ncbi:helicase POLQ-like isoform X1 [Rhagoletis pomonella]|uniref:helicase POLQ-like isoform X1 n=2 Tax=Rhagoletis pomonella TaxID=28610 RepID=UPI0017845840|nr:helicase POLQ-like isoform X1 [Rhagoletis pomonella]
MSKNARKLEWCSPKLTAKRKCLDKKRINAVLQTENLFWPEDDEDSFFTASKVNYVINNKINTHSLEKNDTNLLCSQMTMGAHQEITLFGTQQNSLKLSNFKEDTFFSKSVLDTVMTEYEEIVETKNDSCLPDNCRDDKSVLTVSAVEKLISYTPLELFTSINQNSMTDKTPLEDTALLNMESSNNFHQGRADESIFNTINLHSEQKTESQKQLKFDDTIFANINIEDLTKDEDKELFVENIQDDAGVQNSQRFLDDVAIFKVPHAPAPISCKAGQKIKVPQRDNFVSGSQYTVHSHLSNITSIANLSRLDWDSQAFSDKIENDFPSKGAFFGLPDKVKRMIFEYKGIQSLYEWQEECLNLPAIHERRNLIYALPTSGGKTLVAEILMLREVLCREKDVLFILPYVSIVQEKVSAMSPFAIAMNFIVDEYTAGKGKCPPMKRRKRKSIFIASIEKGAVLIDSLIEAQRADEIGLIVVDELHLIGEKGRGATLEALLTKIMFIDVNIQIVGMSATIGNLEEVSSFLKADVYTRSFRPVELREFIKCGNDILEINTAGKTLDEVFVYSRNVNFNYSESLSRSDPDHLAGLVAECAPEHCVLVFCPSRKNCENVALLLSRILPKKFVQHRKREKEDLMDALDKVCGVLGDVLAKTIPYGIAYHHSGLTIDERKFIETAYRFGVLSVICCTSTLAAGVNLPAKRVIIRAPYVGSEFMTLCRYKQMVGRAGRAGMGEAGESFLITTSRDNIRVGEMLFSPMDKAITSLDYEDCIGLQSLVISAIGLEIANCRTDLYRLVGCTLLSVQANQLGLSTEQMVLKLIREMFKHKVLELCASVASKKDIPDILTTQDVQNVSSRTSHEHRRLFISKSTRFQLTNIGRAAFKAGIDYKHAFAIHAELKLAQKQLILTNYAHLLYLVVSFNSNAKGDELFPAEAGILYRVYMSLDDTTQALFKLLGFTEAVAVKLAKTMSVQGPLELKLNRLYKVLVLIDILNVLPLHVVASRYKVERGMLQTLINQSTAAASAIVRLCEQLDAFWCFKSLFERISAKLDRCGTMELEPLLDLPAVKINRAKQLYSAGFKTIEDIAKCKPIDLVRLVEHMPMKISKEIISAAKIILMKKLDYLEEEAEALKMCLT